MYISVNSIIVISGALKSLKKPLNLNKKEVGISSIEKDFDNFNLLLISSLKAKKNVIIICFNKMSQVRIIKGCVNSGHVLQYEL